MSQKQTPAAPQQEPSMEEILASIRRIISEDDVAPTQKQSAPQPEVEQTKSEVKQPMAQKEKQPKKNFPSYNDDDLLELTDIVEPEETQKAEEEAQELELDEIADEVVEPPKPAPIKQKPAPIQQPEIVKAAKEENVVENNTKHLVSEAVQQTSKAALNELVTAVSRVNYSLGHGDKTLEDIVKDSLKPLLKDWLDANLAIIVEKIVKEEVEYIVKKLDPRK